MLDLETMHHAITRFEMPLRSVAASSQGLAWLAKNGTIDRIQTTGREA